MGRRTWESIPPQFRPLPGRLNVVLTRQQDLTLPEGVLVASSLQNAADQLELGGHDGRVFVIGGAEVYEQALREGLVNSILYTEILEIPGGKAKFDTFFPALPADEWDVQAYCGDDKENERDGTAEPEVHVDRPSGIRYRYLEYTRQKTPPPKNKEERQYLDLCRDVLEHGVLRNDRTGTGTLSQFGTQMRFSLRDNTLPLLTTKRTFWRGVAEELLWFVQVRRRVFGCCC